MRSERKASGLSASHSPAGVVNPWTCWKCREESGSDSAAQWGTWWHVNASLYCLGKITNCQHQKSEERYGVTGECKLITHSLYRECKHAILFSWFEAPSSWEESACLHTSFNQSLIGSMDCYFWKSDWLFTGVKFTSQGVRRYNIFTYKLRKTLPGTIEGKSTLSPIIVAWAAICSESQVHCAETYGAIGTYSGAVSWLTSMPAVMYN